ncbi:hypothetical protein QTP88_001432 [Uroleucon formosanum]
MTDNNFFFNNNLFNLGLLDNVEEEADFICTKPNTNEDTSITVLKCTNEEVIKDTTTDVSILEHFTFLLRYVNDKGKIEERLVALVTSPNSTGKGMYEVLCNITEKYNINWKRDLCAQAYDGAASMQGQYSGLKT